MKKGNVTFIRFVLCGLACCSVEGEGYPAPPPGENSENKMSFFVGSVTECTDDYARHGYCKKAPLTRCVLVDSAYNEDLVCKVVAKASLRSDTGFSRLHSASSTFNVARGSKKVPRCFDYNFLEYPAWDFMQFDSFNGQCQKGTGAAPPRWTCDPETARCTVFEYQQESCLLGWPCMKLHIDPTSLQKTKCTPELVARDVCAAGDPDVFACVRMTIEGPAPLQCDVRFNVERISSRKTEFALVRDELIYAGGIDEVCFRLKGVRDPDEVRSLPVNAVCRSKRDYSGDLSRICDLEKDSCEAESKVVDYD